MVSQWFVIVARGVSINVSDCAKLFSLLITRAANLWVWNAARAEFKHAPFKPGREPGASSSFNQVVATFKNSGKDARFNDAELYYDEDGFFGKLGPDQSVRVNTFKTHVWNIKSKSSGEILKTFVIENDSDAEQFFEV